jgi:opacity protein-like surface antigen
MKNINIAVAVSALVASGAVYSADSIQAQIDNQRSQYVQSVAINTVVSNTNQEGVNVINSIQARIDSERSKYVARTAVTTEVPNPKQKTVNVVNSIQDYINIQKG